MAARRYFGVTRATGLRYRCLAHMTQRFLLPSLCLLLSACDSDQPVDGASKITTAPELGQHLWNQSCPIETIDGVCGHRAAATTVATCASRSKDMSEAPLIIVTRDAANVQAAMAAWTDVRIEFERHQAELLGDPTAVATYQLALSALQAPAFEAYLALQFPSQLNFDPADPLRLNASFAAFTQWVQVKSTAGQNLRAGFAEITALGNDSVIAARAAATFENFAAAMMHGEIPISIRTGEFAEEKSQAYCDALEAQAKPLRAAARR
jgi:hypothetical protein